MVKIVQAAVYPATPTAKEEKNLAKQSALPWFAHLQAIAATHN